MNLETFDISQEYGFLSDPICKNFSFEINDIFYDIILNIKNPNGFYFRTLVEGLSYYKHSKEFYIDIVNNSDDLTKKSLYNTFTFICQKYVRGCGKENIVNVIPYEIGLIWYQSALQIGTYPSTTYSALILNNWNFNNNCNLENLTVHYNLSGTDDESWFYKIHIAIEAKGAEMLKRILNLNTLTTKEDLISFMDDFSKNLKQIRIIIQKIFINCKKEIFFNVIRLFLQGYDNNGGLNIEETDITINYVGGSGAQSTYMHIPSIICGIDYDSDHIKDFFTKSKNLMPEKHRQFLEYLESKPNLKYITTQFNDPEVNESYNNLRESYYNFRLSHYKVVQEYVHSFIQKINDAKIKNDTTLLKTLEKGNISGNDGTASLGTDDNSDGSLMDFLQCIINSTWSP
jgi:hypothetical protein